MNDGLSVGYIRFLFKTQHCIFVMLCLDPVKGNRFFDLHTFCHLFIIVIFTRCSVKILLPSLSQLSAALLAIHSSSWNEIFNVKSR